MSFRNKAPVFNSRGDSRLELAPVGRDGEFPLLEARSRLLASLAEIGVEYLGERVKCSGWGGALDGLMVPSALKI